MRRYNASLNALTFIQGIMITVSISSHAAEAPVRSGTGFERDVG